MKAFFWNAGDKLFYIEIAYSPGKTCVSSYKNNSAKILCWVLEIERAAPIAPLQAYNDEPALFARDEIAGDVGEIGDAEGAGRITQAQVAEQVVVAGQCQVAPGFK